MSPSAANTPLAFVRDSCAWVVSQATHVTIDHSEISSRATEFVTAPPALPAWNFDGVHLSDGTALTAQYLLVVDALNFCFWPDPELDYGVLASGVRDAVVHDPRCIGAEALEVITAPELRRLVGRWPRELPQEEERVRLLREVGRGLRASFNGHASQLVAAAEGSAARLVELLTAHFPGFRDHAIYKGRQVALYKRAQIYAADLWGAFGNKGLGAFRDIADLTIFADYLVPMLLRQWGVLRYSTALAAAVDAGRVLLPGSEEEVELRACSIHAVELLRTLIAEEHQLHRQQQQQQQQQQRQEEAPSVLTEAQVGERDTQFVCDRGPEVLSIELDWWLWSEGLKSDIGGAPHHRTLTIYY